MTRVGRDPGADWAIPDPECEISRHHLEIALRERHARLAPAGRERRLPQRRRRAASRRRRGVARRSATRSISANIGWSSIPSPSPRDRARPSTARWCSPRRSVSNATCPTDWPDASELPPLDDESSLLEAFCEGAKLDVSALSGEEPAEIMRRAGAIYRQMVLGLGDLVSERSTAKAEPQSGPHHDRRGRQQSVQMGADAAAGDRPACGRGSRLPARPGRDQGIVRGHEAAHAGHAWPGSTPRCALPSSSSVPAQSLAGLKVSALSSKDSPRSAGRNMSAPMVR